MSLFSLFAILISVTALLSYVNARYLKLPATIGVTAAALVVSLVLVMLGFFGLAADEWAASLLQRIDFDSLLMDSMLSFLLFAGALHVDLNDLLSRKWSILSLATVGVVISTALVGLIAWLIFGLLGIDIPPVYALLFGALITPTDPIAVLSVLKTANTPKLLEVIVAGESLFNDGVAVVVFTLVLGFATGNHAFSAASAAELFFVEALGGALIGLVAGFVAYRMLRTVDNYVVEILITLALVSGGYSLALALHTSGPIAMVVAGVLIGNHGRVFGMSEQTRQHVDTFWELIDEILNAMLFVMIGFELLVLEFRPGFVVAGLLMIPVVVLVRFVSVSLPIGVLRRFRTFLPYTVTMLTWCGVRGGISIALALSIPPSPERSVILFVTYAIVVFSILVQGLTIGRLARWVGARS
jgi:CPA1 family monovalent cation:H+ antiporter